MQSMQRNTSSLGTSSSILAGTLIGFSSRGDSLAELTHDARNMVLALMLYCDLLEERGVLSPAFRHYAGELRLVAASSRRLVDKLSLARLREAEVCAVGPGMGLASPVMGQSVSPVEAEPDIQIGDLRAELLAASPLLEALAGTAVSVKVTAVEGAQSVWLMTEDLTRVLVNLVKNSVEAMQKVGQKSGRIGIALTERVEWKSNALRLVMTVEDSGPGIAPERLEAIFPPACWAGFRAGAQSGIRRGLGLSICRSIVESAGGRIQAENGESGGARIVIELPVRGQ